MKPPRCVLLLLSLGATLAGTAHAADRFADTRARIAALIGPRVNPQLLPANLPNPFATGSGRPAVESKPGNPIVPATDDASILARFAATLRIMGVMRIGDTPHLVINSSPYKEGDLIQLPDSEPPEYIRILRIGARELTLGYNDATMRLPLP